MLMLLGGVSGQVGGHLAFKACLAGAMARDWHGAERTRVDAQNFEIA
jgi:hypothetical protein